MYYFNNDYSEGAHKKILEALIKTNFEQCPGYGLDEHCQKAAELLKEKMGRNDVDVHFVSGGTQANKLCLAAFLRPHEAIICPDSGHINVHETGAVEASGHKIIAVRGKDGKILPEEILNVLAVHHDEHMVKPKAVFVTDATEIGTIYTLDELKTISKVCHENDLYLYLDGARLANALTAEGNDVSLADLANLTDAFYLGGTKNGLLFGEAIVIVNPSLKADFRYITKQNGAMLAKGRILGVQFTASLSDDLYLETAKHANMQAQKIQSALEELAVPLFIKTPTNQIFPIMENDKLVHLHESFVFSDWEKIDAEHTAVRFVCSWATKNEDVEALIATLRKLYAHQ